VVVYACIHVHIHVSCDICIDFPVLSINVYFSAHFFCGTHEHMLFGMLPKYCGETTLPMKSNITQTISREAPPIVCFEASACVLGPSVQCAHVLLESIPNGFLTTDFSRVSVGGAVAPYENELMLYSIRFAIQYHIAQVPSGAHEGFLKHAWGTQFNKSGFKVRRQFFYRFEHGHCH
jgi:hypothetical protein